MLPLGATMNINHGIHGGGSQQIQSTPTGPNSLSTSGNQPKASVAVVSKCI